jgi:DNA repair protein RadA/Sms
MGLDSRSVFLLAQNNLEDLLAVTYQMRPQAVIVDSIQSVYLPEASSSAGGVTQVRECAARLTEMAKAHSISTFIVGHVTKSGEIAGPRVLEHIVDAVLYLEGERHHSYRILRSVKNRFGSTNEVGVFEMTARGMVEVLNPSEAFLAERLDSVPGSSVAVTIEGTRPLLVEIQALTSPCAAPAGPRRTANGVDFNRLLLLTAVLTKRLGLRLANQDVFVNVIGGLRISEPAADLGVASAIASAARGRAVAPDVAVFGEIGLSGELRSVNQVERRLHEAAKLGFKRAILPRSSSLSDLRVDGVELLPTRTLAEALKAALG